MHLEIFQILMGNSYPADVQLLCATVNLQHKVFGSRHEKICLRWFASNKGADQPAHPRRLISTFAFRFLESIISKLATGEISIF